MFRPIAVAAKMITWVAIDMLASEPPWVNGKAKATTKADRISTRLCRWETADSQPITPTRNSTATTVARKARKVTNAPASSLLSANAAANSAAAMSDRDGEDLPAPASRRPGPASGACP